MPTRRLECSIQHNHQNSDISSKTPTIYPAFLSQIADELKRRITLSDNVKDDIEYKNSFNGKEIVDKLKAIIKTSDKDLAIRIGRSLSAQRFFHDVSYECQLVYSTAYLYEFTNFVSYITDLRQPRHEIGLPNGIVTELTRCYSPTCFDMKPCYSPICPKRLLKVCDARKDISSVSNLLAFEVPIGTVPRQLSTAQHSYWKESIDKTLYESIPKIERQRQENIHELIYTEEDYVQSLNYLREMWIKPLSEQMVIPMSRRAPFIQKVFGGLNEIHNVNLQLLNALQIRQSQHAIIPQIGDILLDFVVNFEPYISYGTKQYEAKFVLENERYINPHFNAFVERVERHSTSKKLEINGYLTKPTTRLGRYTLLINEILKHTPPDNVDAEDLPKAMAVVKRFLIKINEETGKAKNRFDLERIHHSLRFKYKADMINLDLLNKNRILIKQAVLRKSVQPNSTEYQVFLFDHYLVIAKAKFNNGVETYVIQQRPIPIELLSAFIKDDAAITQHHKRSNTLTLPYIKTNNSNTSLIPPLRAATDMEVYRRQQESTTNQDNNDSLHAFPITFQHLGRDTALRQCILYAPSSAARNAWITKIKQQQDKKNTRRPLFRLAPAFVDGNFSIYNRIQHFTTFGNGQKYLLAADDGVYVGHCQSKNTDTTPQKVLSLPRASQVQVIESTERLLVLADRMLWEYPLTVVNNKPETQSEGRLLQSNVPFFHVGTCMRKTMVCVPKVSSLKSVISVYEANSKQQPFSETYLKKIKDTYVPCEAYAIELTPTMMLITSSRGMIMIDMKTDHPQQLLNPKDENLAFILERERQVSPTINLKQPIKRMAIFKTQQSHYILCYDEYAFYINSKGDRLFNHFLIAWEGCPEAFAFVYPFVLGFDPNFIEVRNVHTVSIY
ncbi:hypothetical protein BDF20DRAFT_826085 [Mycotypha africana]|uniref:uncharacterized protein n=1 Tax=Mycotypha africana TaxID=64632 RepID=UPI002301548F|nr:uncharacterized protein BDF20DRAFT_826085 [Mycotypha africana]KAI8970021.1 hypothetical protein BDF20DRAFT_826085 [Mycotypha africana]